MKYHKFLAYFIAFLPIIISQTGHSMQPATPKVNPETVSVCDFDSKRDMDSVTNIFKSDWEKLYIGRPFDPELIKHLLAKDTIPSATKKMLKVLRHENKTVGFATYYFFNERTPKEGYLEIGGLAPEIRNQGVGTRFFPLILAELEGLGSEILTVFVKKDNIAAKTLYEKFGFKISEEAMKGTSFKLVKVLKANEPSHS